MPPPFVLLRHVRTLVEPPPAASDRDLLHRFARHRDEDAFAALLRRHGPMVLRVCRRFLAAEADAEDAFQAVFVTLARKAGAVRWRDSAAGWLYGVACHAALRVRLAAARRRRHELAGAAPRGTDPLAEMSARELLSALDEALTGLPEKYRDPLVLYYLEGMTREEVAERLGCPLGTLKGRLARGKELLHAALERRGLSLSALLAAALVGRGAAGAAVPQALARTALRAAVLATPAAAGWSVGAIAVALALTIGLVAAGAAWTVSATTAAPAEEPARPVADKPLPGGDGLGDPLPEGAIARLGTTRLRTGRHHLFLPDSRRFVQSREDGSVEISDVKTGKPLARLQATDVPGRKHLIVSTAAASPDSKHLAAVCWEGRCGVWETATGRLVRWLESGGFYSIVRCDFSPDGKRLAVGGRPAGGGAEDFTVGVYDIESGRQLFKAPGTNSVFAPDGKTLVAWDGYRSGANQTVRSFAVPGGNELSGFTCSMRLVDFFPPSDGTSFFEVLLNGTILQRTVATGEVKHTLRGPEGGGADPVYIRHAPNRRELIAVATNPAGIWCWDKATGKELWTARLAAKAYYPSLSRDGKVLALGDTAGTVRVLDAATGGERASFKPATIGHASRARVSPDGKLVATTSGGDFTMAIAFWDAATGKPVHGISGHAASITAAAFTPDGAGVYTVGLDRTLRAWDADTGQERWRAAADPASYLAVSADGKAIYAAGPDGGTVQVLSARTGESERRFPAFAHAVAGLALTRDGARLIAAGRDSDRGDSLVRILDARSGAKLRDWAAASAKVEQLAIRPNGEAIATTHVGQRVLLWDGCGKRVLEQVGRGERVSVRDRGKKPPGSTTPYRIGAVAVSPDGRWLAYADQELGVAIVDVQTGREVGRVKMNVYHQSPSIRDDLREALAFSPDGQTIAWSGVESSADVFLIEARTARPRGRLPGDSAPVQHLLFSPDGSRLLSAGTDGSALVWDVTGRRRAERREGKPLTPADVEACWADLKGADAARAYQAIRKLTSSPAEAVAWMRTRLRPAVVPDAKRIARLIDELDSDAFATREEATKQLTALAATAEAALREALEKAPSAESRQRITRLLAEVETTPAGDALRHLRGVEMLERIGTPEARRELRRLGEGAAEARLTREARAALSRLDAARVRDR